MWDLYSELECHNRTTMRTLPLIVIAAFAAVALAADKIKVTPKFEAGQKAKWKTELKMNVGGTEAVLSGTIVSTIKSADAGVVKAEDGWENPKAVVGGEEMQIPFGPTSYVLNAAGELQEVSGGITGTDVARNFMVTYAYLPKDEIEKDGKWTATYAKTDKMEIGERKVEGTYLGEEEVLGKKAHKFKTKMTEGDFTVSMTYWATLEGKVIKIDGEFANLPIPVAGDNASGTVKADWVD